MCIYVYIYTNEYVQMYIYICMYVYMHMRTCMYICICICVPISVCICICICISPHPQSGFLVFRRCGHPHHFSFSSSLGVKPAGGKEVWSNPRLICVPCTRAGITPRLKGSDACNQGGYMPVIESAVTLSSDSDASEHLLTPPSGHPAPAHPPM